MRRLLHDGRAEDAYSLAEEALALFPDSDELRLGAAFAAQAAGRCAQVDSHLLQLDEDSLAPALQGGARPIFVWRATVPGNSIFESMRSLAIDRHFWTRPAIRSSVWNRGRRYTGSVGGYGSSATLTVLSDPQHRAITLSTSGTG